MDDIDNFFGDEAADAFVAGLHVDMSGLGETGAGDAESREDFARALLDSDELLLSALIGDNFREKLKTG
jgi:hypothetical protein